MNQRKLVALGAMPLLVATGVVWASNAKVAPPPPPRDFEAASVQIAIEVDPKGEYPLLVVPQSMYTEWQATDRAANPPAPSRQTAANPGDGPRAAPDEKSNLPIILGAVGAGVVVLLIAFFLLRPGARNNTTVLLLVTAAVLGLTTALWASAEKASPPPPTVPLASPAALSLADLRTVIVPEGTTIRLILPGSKLEGLKEKKGAEKP